MSLFPHYLLRINLFLNVYLDIWNNNSIIMIKKFKLNDMLETAQITVLQSTFTEGNASCPGNVSGISSRASDTELSRTDCWELSCCSATSVSIGCAYLKFYHFIHFLYPEIKMIVQTIE